MNLRTCFRILMLGTVGIAAQADHEKSANNTRLEEPISTLQELNKVIEVDALTAYQRADRVARAETTAPSFDHLYLRGAIHLRSSHLRYELLQPGAVNRLNNTKPDADEFKDVLDKHGTYKGERHSAQKIEESVRAIDGEAERLLKVAPTTKNR